MELTPRDVLYLCTFVGSLVALYIGIVVRLTKLETKLEPIVQRVEKVEAVVDELKLALRPAPLRARRG